MSRNIAAFLTLVRAGLWADVNDNLSTNLNVFAGVDWGEVYRLAQEQSVVGLVAEGIERFKIQVPGFKIPQALALTIAGEVLQLEQRNRAMNQYIVVMLTRFGEAGIDAVLIKGQGVAQCYAKPLWRSAGDVDLLLNEENYKRGKTFLAELSETAPEEYNINKEYITTVEGFCLELHGSLRCNLSSAFNRGVDLVQKEICDQNSVRYWETDGNKIPLPEENHDVLVIFTHFIKHFYKGGLGIRQICDWCRLMWTYRESLDYNFLESRLCQMKLMTEWKAFAAYVVDYLGMPAKAVPFYSADGKWSRKADRIGDFMMEVGNFGHNVDGSYYSKYPFLIRKAISMMRRIGVMSRHARVFPVQTIRYLPHVLFTGLKSAAMGE